MAKQSEATLLLKIKAAGEEVLESTGSALASLGKAATAAFAVVSTGVVASIHAYKESEEATNSLNQALINQGIYSKSLSSDYQKMASQLQQVTTYSDDSIVAAQGQLQMYVGQNKITKELTKSILDFATAQKMDLNSAAEIVGKTISGGTNMLSRHRIVVDENASATEKMTQVIDGLNSKFGGQAEAAAQGLGGLQQMQIAMGDILEVAGEKLSPVISSAAQAMKNFAISIQNNETIIGGFVKAVHAMAQGGTIAKAIFESIATVLGQSLGTALGAVSQAIAGNFSQAWETVKSGFSDTAGEVKKGYLSLQADLEAVDAAFMERKTVENEIELERLQTSEDRKREIIQGGVVTLEQMFAARDAKELALLQFHEANKGNVALQGITKAIALEKDKTMQYELEMQKRRMIDTAFEEHKNAHLSAIQRFEATINGERVKGFEQGLNSMIQLQNSKSKEMAAIGKAAAMMQIAIDTYRGAMSAYAALAWIPFVGHWLGTAAAAVVLAYGGEKMASVAGLSLAEGGIVKATPGGVQATIGEGGKDEAVIPLDDMGMGGVGMGGSIHITVYGGMLGDQAQAREFALAVDKELLKLRQSNESLSFDQGVI